MASLRGRSLFLLENSVLKFDLSGVERRNKHDIFQSRYQLGEFHYLYNELRRDSTKFFQYCRMSPSPFVYRVSQEECAILRESVPYVELYRYNPKHLYPKLNGYGDNGQRSLKL